VFVNYLPISRAHCDEHVELSYRLSYSLLQWMQFLKAIHCVIIHRIKDAQSENGHVSLHIHMNKQKHSCYYFTSRQDFNFIMKTCWVH